MKANRSARDRLRRAPDGGQMLLLAGFILAATVILSVGTYTVLQRAETDVVRAQSEDMIDLFLNTRKRTIDYFSIVSPQDNNASLEAQLDAYLAGQYRTARSLSLDLNASLAGAGSDAPVEHTEINSCPETDGFDTTDHCEEGTTTYNVDAYDGAESYKVCEFDGNDDGLITNDDGKILAAILWIRVLAPQGELEEVIVVDVEQTSVVGSRC